MSWARLATFYAASFSALGVFLQFFPAWMNEVQGFGERDIAVVLSAVTIARTVAGPLWAQSADRRGDARRVLRILSAGSVGAFALFAFAPSLVGAWCVALAFGCLYAPMHSIVDATAVREGARHGFAFGRLRMVGSLSFLVAILAVGAWLERAPTGDVYWILLGCLVATAIAGRFVPRGAAPAESGDAPPVSWRRLLRSRPFVTGQSRRARLRSRPFVTGHGRRARSRSRLFVSSPGRSARWPSCTSTRRAARRCARTFC